MIKIDFSKTHETYGTFADALYLDENHTYTDEEIEAIVEMSNRPPKEVPQE